MFAIVYRTARSVSTSPHRFTAQKHRVCWLLRRLIPAKNNPFRCLIGDSVNRYRLRTGVSVAKQVLVLNRLMGDAP